MKSTTNPDAMNLSLAFGAAVQQAAPSVVNLDARRFPTSGLALSTDGLILAASHAIEREDKIGVLLADGSKGTAQLLGREPSLDLALLKADVALSPASVAQAAPPAPGQLVLGLYRPDADIRVRLGIVEGVGPAFDTAWGGHVDAELQVGVSARDVSALVLVDANGALLGLRVSGGRGRGLTLPVATLQRVADGLKKHGRVRRGYLGLATQPLRVPESIREAGSRIGLLVVGVEPDSPAAKAGIVFGDVLLNVDGGALEDIQDLWRVLGEDRIGSTVKVKLLRAGQAQEASVTVGERP
jgi:S1-C subfamily serine protease